MSKFRFNITMTLDGFVAGPNQNEEQGLGEGGEPMHDWMVKLKSFSEIQGGNGEGETGINDEVLREGAANIGATIMGRNMFGPTRGPWGEGAWRGWWGENPPYHTPVFVLTHHAREPLVMEGGTTFHFVTDGIESALRQAQAAAGAKDIALAGGAEVFQQYFAAGLLDEIDIHLVPMVLGGGARLFDNPGGSAIQLEQVRTIEGPGVTHLKYRVVK